MLCPKVDPFFKYSWNKGEAFYLPMETTIEESLQSFNLLKKWNGPIKMVHCQKERKKCSWPGTP
jgi:Mor family transcriptional regulator